MYVKIRRLFRLIAMAAWVVLGCLITLVLWLPRKLKLISMHTVLTFARWWYKCLLRIMNARVRVEGDLQHKPGMWVSNHISWLDIAVIGSQARVHFVSKVEVRSWPVVGFLAQQTGTLFIRRGANESGRIAHAMSARIQDGHGVLFFPEGTTGDGSFLRRFHPRLFAGALALQCPVIPLAIRYEHEQQPHPQVPYRKGQNLMSNLWQLLALPRLDITLHAAPSINQLPAQRRELADLAHAQVSGGLKLPQTPDT